MKRFTLFLVLALVFLEWLDFSLSLYLAKSVFAPEFFPPSHYNLVLTFALFAMTFLARPIGGWLWGRQADLYGRKYPLISSAALMGIATLLICLLPNYQVIGIWATWGLIILRIGQGLALGGEMNNSAMYLVEHYRQNKPLLAGSLVAACGASGMFVGGATAALLQTAPTNAWRLVFLLVGVVSLWLCRVRKQLPESPEYIKNQLTLKQIWPYHRQGMLNIAALALYTSVMVYMCNVLWVSYAIDCQLGSASQCAWSGALAQLCAALGAIGVAYLNPSASVYKLLKLSMISAIFTGPLLFYSTTSLFYPGVLLGLSGYILANAFLCAALYYFLYLQLPATYRCRGVSTIWALAASIGAISLPIAQQAINSGKLWLPSFLVSHIAALALYIILGLSQQSSAVKSFIKKQILFKG